MGCVIGKPLVDENGQENLGRVKASDRNRASNFRVTKSSSSRREGVGKIDDGELKVSLTSEKESGSKRVYDDQIEKNRRDKVEEIKVVLSQSIIRVPKAVEGEQVAAGWPSWLSLVAGEAIKGWVPRRAETFERLDKIGQGTYSHVYKARDVLSNKFVAIKKVMFDSDPESVNFMAREILILRRLDHPNIIKLEGLITSKKSRSLYLIFEYMEHDLTGLTSLPGIKFSEPQVKCYMQQLLSGLDHCHSRGVLHRDIKCSNLLIDNNGILKIADFGLASLYDPRHSVPMTSRVVTLWYRPPELLLGAVHYGASVDLWSAGCILGELFARKPIMPGKTEVEQMHKIFKLCGSPSEDFWRKSKLPHAPVFKPRQPYKRNLAETFKSFPATAVALLETLLSIDPAQRGTAAHALNSEFFTTKPFAGDPSSLPKYPPSKEIDAKTRDEEAKRTNRRENSEKTRAGNTEFVSSMKTRQSNNAYSNTRSELCNSKEEPTYGFPNDSSRQSQPFNRISKDCVDNHHRDYQSGPLIRDPVDWSKSGKKCDDQTRSHLSTLSGLVATRNKLCEEHREKCVPSKKTNYQTDKFHSSLNDWDSVRKQDQYRQSQIIADSHDMEDYSDNEKPSYMYGHESPEDKTAYSVPLFHSSKNIDEVLLDHDRKIQESVRRSRMGKARGKQVVSH